MYNMQLPLVGAFLAVAVVSCGVEDNDDSQDATANNGVKLESSDGLQATIRMLDGTKAATKNQRFIKTTLQGAGKKVDFWCDLGGHVAPGESVSKLSCTKGVGTVSGDDNEAITFDIAFKHADKTAQIVNYEYVGDGTFLGDEDEAINPGGSLTGKAVDLAIQKRMTLSRDVFKLADRLAAATEAFVNGPSLVADGVPEVVRPAIFADYSLSSTMELTTNFALAEFRQFTAAGAPVSVLKTKGKPSSGLLTEAAIESRLESALPLQE